MRTPSKINLFLRVAGRRSDGYHELETLFYPLSEPADEVSLGFDPAQTETKFILESEQGACAVPATPDNLCIRALNMFCSAASLPAAPHTVTLKKKYPRGCGDGGRGIGGGLALGKCLSEAGGPSFPQLCTATQAPPAAWKLFTSDLIEFSRGPTPEEMF